MQEKPLDRALFEASQTIMCLVLSMFLVDQLLLGKVTMMLNYCQLYTICLIVNWWNPKSVEIIL